MVDLSMLLFALAILAGLGMAFRVLRSRGVSPWAGLGHGMLASCAAGILLGRVLEGPPSKPLNMAVLLFGLALLGGLVLLLLRARRDPHPAVFVILHGSMALLAFAVLAAAAL
ncbi:MAG TPA: hypothetical protein VFA86_01485 [Gammaproteobacteria bacterium]|nr:hypothetical protein [Gammaproteobacteria bacterium]